MRSDLEFDRGHNFRRDVERALASSDVATQRATEATPDFASLPWMNVVKIGGQSIMDRGRAAVAPLIDEIVANLGRHKMVLATGAGTRATETCGSPL